MAKRTIWMAPYRVWGQRDGVTRKQAEEVLETLTTSDWLYIRDEYLEASLVSDCEFWFAVPYTTIGRVELHMGSRSIRVDGKYMGHFS